MPISLITILLLSLIVGVYYIYERLLLRKLNNPDYEIRLRVVKQLGENLERAVFNKTTIVDQLFEVIKNDVHWFVRLEALKAVGFVRLEALKAVANYLYPKQQHIRFSRNHKQYKLAAVDTWLNVLENDEPEVQKVAAVALGKTQSIRVIKPLLKALDNPELYVRASARTALDEACVAVRIIMFGSKGDEQNFDQQQKEGNPERAPLIIPISETFFPKITRGALFNPDVSQLTASMPKLQHLIIDAQTCDMSLVTAFAKYMILFLLEDFLKSHVNICIAGNPILFSVDVYQAFPKCKSIDVSIETIIFGNASTTPHDPYKTVVNPDFSVVTIPMPRLKTLIIHTDTYDFRQIEYFLTYAVNYIGQNRLKKFVNVHIYGDLATLHPNLRNSFTNLCKVVIAHEPHE